MKCKRIGLEVDAVLYELDKGLEDGFELLRDIVVNGWITTENLVTITRDNGSMLCPFINNRRGRSFIANGDYIIIEKEGDRYVCGSDKFFDRFEKMD